MILFTPKQIPQSQSDFWALGGYLEGTRTLVHLRHSGTRTFKALRHMGTQVVRTLRHLGTHALKAFGKIGTRGTLFRRFGFQKTHTLFCRGIFLLEFTHYTINLSSLSTQLLV